MSNFICYNGSIRSAEEVKISPVNRGMMYGDGCFETLKSYSGKFLAYEEHFHRLKNAFEYLNIDFIFTKNGLLESILSLIEANNITHKEAIIRFQCWRKGGRGYKTDSRECEWIITTQSVENFAPLKLVTSKTPAIPSTALNRSIKLSNALNYVIAVQEASEKQADDSLMFTMDGFVSETTTSNIFWGKDNSIFTPSEDCDLLSGVTRNLVKELLDNSDSNLIEGKFTLRDISRSDFIFATNSVSEIRAVEQLDDIKFDSNHPELIRIRSKFDALKDARLL